MAVWDELTDWYHKWLCGMQNHIRDFAAHLLESLGCVQSISADVSTLTGDSGTKYNLRQLIESLSRLVNN